MMWPGRQLPQYLLHESRRFSDFIKAHGHSRCNITLRAHGLFGREVAIRIAGQVASQIKCLAAGASCKAGQAYLRGQRGRDDTSSNKPVAQASVFVVDCTQCFDLGSNRIDRINQEAYSSGRKIHTRAAWHNEIHEITLPECLLGRAKQLLLEPRELGESKGKASIVRNRTEIT